jgi:GNAT superfamily N-acetyltransferase
VTRLVRLWRSFRTRGLRATIRAVVDRYIYHAHKRVIVRCGFAGPPVADHVGDVRFRLATPLDFDRLDELERYGRGSSTHRAYVEKDRDWLFVACHGDRIVATLRYGCVVRDAVAAQVVQLGPGQMWAADVFCLPEYRSQSIGRHLLLFAWRFLASRGYTEVFGTVTVTNMPSIRMSVQAGCKLHCFVSYVRVLLYERLSVSKEFPGHVRNAGNAG